MDTSLPAAPTGEPQPSWFSTWLKAVTQPSFATFQEIAAHPNATAGRAHLWVGLSTLAGFIVYIVLNVPIQGAMGMLGGSSASGSIGLALTGSLTGLICGLPIGLAMAVGMFALGTYVTLKVARSTERTVTYGTLAYVFASYASPIGFVIVAANALSVFGLCLILPVSIYGIVLSVIALRAVTGAGTGSAIFATFVRALVEVVVSGLLVCIASVILTGLIGGIASTAR